MYLIAVAWAYVVVMMAAAEALSPQGTVLGASFTLLLYGVLPLGIVLYLLGTPHRRRARRAAEMSTAAAPDGGAEASAEAVAPVGKEP